MPSAADWITALRSSHERYRATAETLDADQVTGPSYASEWTIAQVASHLGSGAEIFDLFLNAGLTGSPAPGGDQFGPIWDRWNNTPPAEQVANSIPANEAFVARLEGMTEEQQAEFALQMFGMDTDLAALAGMRLGEHALHTWDVLVALEPDATVSDDAVELLVDRLGQTAARAGKPVESGRFVIATSNPERTFLLDVGPEVNLVQGASGTPDVELSSEAFIRLVFGRLDPEHTPSDVKDDETLALLRRVFPGF